MLSQVKLIAEPWDLRSRAATRSAASRPAGPSGTTASATRCGLTGSGDGGKLPELAARLTGLGRPVQQARPQALGHREFRHGARWLHPARSRLVQRQAQRGERRGQPRRPFATTSRAITASRVRPTTPSIAATAASARCATCWRRCSCRAARRCCWRGDEFGAHAAGQQQRLLPGQRDLLGRLGRASGPDGRGAGRVRAQADHDPPGAADAAPRTLPDRRVRRGAGRQGRDLADAGRRRR